MTLPYSHVGPHQPYWPQARPGAVTTFYVYCGLMILIYLLVAAAGVFFVTMAAELAADDPDMTEQEARIMGVVFLIMGLGLSLLFGVMMFLPRRKWAWIVGIVGISLGLTSCCFWPLCIPLLIYFVQEPTRRWYGMEPPMPMMMYGPPPPMPYAPMPYAPMPPQPSQPSQPSQPPQPPQDPRWGGPA